jgi:DNA-binding transcriptional LysR family regulator
MPHLGDFLAEYPEIRVDATLTDETVDLIATGTDLAIRIGALADSRLVAKRLAAQNRAAVASPAYLAKHPPIATPAELEGQECLAFALHPKDSWYFRPHDAPREEPTEIPIRGRLRANDSEALLNAALAGLGIALLPTWLTGEDIATGRLVSILPAWEALIAPGPARAIWGVYPPKKVVAPKVRAFLGFIEHRFGKPPYWDGSHSFRRSDIAAK